MTRTTKERDCKLSCSLCLGGSSQFVESLEFDIEINRGVKSSRNKECAFVDMAVERAVARRY